MDDNFSSRVKDVISYSKEEALRLGHKQIGTEHLLLGMLRDGGGKAISILNSIDVNLDELRKNIELLNPAIIDSSELKLNEKKNLHLTRQAERALKTTFLEAKLFQNNSINTAHLLLCILRNDNDPRLKANAVIINEKNSTFKKGVFTICKKRKDKCPPWAIYADEVNHDKNEKIIRYKNAWLEIYDKPILYFPKFFHPDPTVKRQSGFLFPTIKSSSLYGQSIQIPYFKVISDNKDLTISPRLYFDNNFFMKVLKFLIISSLYQYNTPVTIYFHILNKILLHEVLLYYQPSNILQDLA